MPKPKRHLTKGERTVAGSRAGIEASGEPVSSANNAQSAPVGMPSQAEMQTQAAARLFLQQIEKITDAQIVRSGNGETYSLAFKVAVPDLWSEAADQVYTLRGDLYRKYPDAQIEIEVHGKCECSGEITEVERNEGS